MPESNQPRWQIPSANAGLAMQTDFSVVPRPRQRLCANLKCCRPLAALNKDVLCYRCQDEGTPRRMDRRTYRIPNPEAPASRKDANRG